MARIENTKMTVSLDNDSKRLIRTLTKAIDRLAKTQEPSRDYEGVKRLSEPVTDVAEGGYDRGEEVSDEDELRRKRPEMFSEGGYTGKKFMESEPDKGYYIPGKPITLDPATVQALAAVAGKYRALG